MKVRRQSLRETMGTAPRTIGIVTTTPSHGVSGFPVTGIPGGFDTRRTPLMGIPRTSPVEGYNVSGRAATSTVPPSRVVSSAYEDYGAFRRDPITTRGYGNEAYRLIPPGSEGVDPLSGNRASFRPMYESTTTPPRLPGRNVTFGGGSAGGGGASQSSPTTPLAPMNLQQRFEEAGPMNLQQRFEEARAMHRAGLNPFLPQSTPQGGGAASLPNYTIPGSYTPGAPIFTSDRTSDIHGQGTRNSTTRIPFVAPMSGNAQIPLSTITTPAAPTSYAAIGTHPTHGLGIPSGPYNVHSTGTPNVTYLQQYQEPTIADLPEPPQPIISTIGPGMPQLVTSQGIPMRERIQLMFEL